MSLIVKDKVEAPKQEEKLLHLGINNPNIDNIGSRGLSKDIF